MPDNKKRPIIIKRGGDSGEHGHHGGAWKIAYADFMTAMMAFFLVMWLLNATTEEQRKGIAQFFNPMAEKDTRLGSSNGMLETSPSPLTAGTTLRKVKDGDAPDDDGGEQPGAKDAARRSEEGGSPDNITRGLKAHLTPASPAIIPVGGPESGGGKSIGTIGVDNPVAAAAEQTKIDNMVQGLEQSVAQNPDTQDAAKNMTVSFGRDDIRIELRDANNTPMFDTASATPNAAGRKMLEQIGAWLAPMPEQLSIVGYTDADQYRTTKRGVGMSNWTLSAQRADGAREVLVRAGYPDRNILSVSGRADRDLAVPAEPDSAANRRVVLILHRRFVNPDQAGGGAIVPLPAGAPAATAPAGQAAAPAAPSTPPAAGPAQPAASGAATPAATPAPAPAAQPAAEAPAPAARRTRGVRVRTVTRPRTPQTVAPAAPVDQPFQPSQDTWTPAPQ